MHTKTITKGSILIARPSGNDQIFNRSVILICNYGEHGAVGFILNKPSERTLKEYISEFTSNLSVYHGGPVEKENIYYIHRRPDLISDSEWITGDLYWSGSYADIKYNIQNGFLTKDDVRFFLGYSGWGFQQLENEISNRAWEVADSENIDIFKDWKNNLWQELMRKLGGDNLLWINAPNNPGLN